MKVLITFSVILILIMGCSQDDSYKMESYEKAKTVLLFSQSKLHKGESFLMVEGFDDALDYYETSRDTAALLDMYQLAAIKMRWLGNQDSASMFLNKAVDIASETTSPSKSELFIELSNLEGV